MQLLTTDRKNVRVLTVPGDITFRNSEDFHGALVERAGDESIRHVVLNVASVGFVNSTAIGSLVWLHNAMARRGGKVALVQVQPDVRRLLTTTRLDQNFLIRDSVDEAVNELASA